MREQTRQLIHYLIWRNLKDPATEKEALQNEVPDIFLLKAHSIPILFDILVQVDAIA